MLVHVEQALAHRGPVFFAQLGFFARVNGHHLVFAQALLVLVALLAQGHLLAMQKGRQGERYILGNTNLLLNEVFHMLSRITGVKAPSLKLPRLAILPLAYANHWFSNVTGLSPRIPLEGVKMAKYKMHYDCSKAIRELGLPQTPVEVALEKAVRWFREHGYA